MARRVPFVIIVRTNRKIEANC
uniref:Uncharacterized protein n=1 Tax=Rhizophora mucronata TaxID=61149 RepID=A0A2P2MI95_RHIMU